MQHGSSLCLTMPLDVSLCATLRVQTKAINMAKRRNRANVNSDRRKAAARRVLLLRTALKLDQDKCGLSRATVARIEDGENEVEIEEQTWIKLEIGLFAPAGELDPSKQWHFSDND